MKHLFLLSIFLYCFAARITAQNEIPADSLENDNKHLPSDMESTSSDIYSYDGFLLDMGHLLESPSSPSSFKLEIPDASKDYSFLFRLNPNASYTQASSNSFFPGSFSYHGSSPFWGSPTDNLQKGSFRLGNGLRINMYGEYDKDGWKVHNPSTLPWERNNFKGAFELKSSNGAFGVRIEVQQGRKSPF